MTFVSNNIYASLVNIRFAAKGRPTRITFDDRLGVFTARDQSHQIHFCRRGRENRYKRSVQNATLALTSDYHLNKIDIVPGGMFIDCGANVGELGFWAKENQLNYMPFEPEELEARCCDLNHFSGEKKTHQKALWKEDTELTFYSLPNSADSSAFDMDEKSHKTTVTAVTLDSMVDLSGFNGTKILKLEAEGAEPEVLEGAQNTLQYLDYVAVDCGYERGKGKSHTFLEIHKMLTTSGFAIEQANFRRVTMLYGRASATGQ